MPSRHCVHCPHVSWRKKRPITSAARTSEPTTNGNDTDAWVPKVGVPWQPFDEQLTIRSTWGEGFLEPNLFQLYGGPLFTLALTSLPVPGTPALRKYLEAMMSVASWVQVS